MITHTTNSNLLLENALGVLLRCVNRSRSRLGFQKKVCTLLRTDLIQILSSGSPLAKRRTAAILSHLSWRITDSSLAREEGGCPVHGSNCSIKHCICLVADKAVKPLIEMVKTMEVGSIEAALTALDTLFDDGCDGNGAAAAIVESNGATPILDVLERGEMAAKKMAFELFCKIFEHSDITEMELDRFKGIALNIVRKGDYPSSDIAEMARTVLKNLCINIKSTVLMAKNGYFTPFLEQFNSQEISDENRASMAEELSKIPLTETCAKNLEDEQFIANLTEMLSCNFPSSKISSLNCIEQFISFKELRTLFLQNKSAIDALLGLITTKSMEEELKQKSFEILIFLIQTTQPSDPSLQVLFSSAVREILNQIETSALEDRISLLRLLLFIVQNSNSAGKFIVTDHNAIIDLCSAINVERNSQVKMNALELLYHIAGNQRIVIPLPSLSLKKSIVGSLITILNKSRIDEELSAAIAATAAGILFHLWPDDQSIDKMLQSSDVLKSIHDMITHTTNSNLLLENALGVLLRCVNRSQSPSRSRSRLGFQKKVCTLLRTDLIQILSSGSPLAKQRTAAILTHLSWRVTDSSLAREEGGCPVHGSNCSLKHCICLVADKAVKPLIEMVKTMGFGLIEAALTALDTLFDDGCDRNRAAAAIVESNGATPILNVLERGEMAAKKMAFELFCKIFKHSDITERELDRFKGIALNMVRKGDGLMIKAKRLLKDLV